MTSPKNILIIINNWFAIFGILLFSPLLYIQSLAANANSHRSTFVDTVYDQLKEEHCRAENLIFTRVQNFSRYLRFFSCPNLFGLSIKYAIIKFVCIWIKCLMCICFHAQDTSQCMFIYIHHIWMRSVDETNACEFNSHLECVVMRTMNTITCLHTYVCVYIFETLNLSSC